MCHLRKFISVFARKTKLSASASKLRKKQKRRQVKNFIYLVFKFGHIVNVVVDDDPSGSNWIVFSNLLQWILFKVTVVFLRHHELADSIRKSFGKSKADTTQEHVDTHRKRTREGKKTNSTSFQRGLNTNDYDFCKVIRQQLTFKDVACTKLNFSHRSSFCRLFVTPSCAEMSSYRGSFGFDSHPQ